MELRITIFDYLRKSLILTTPPFRSIDAMVAWANTFIRGISPALVLFITNEKNKDVGYLKPTPNGYIASELERSIMYGEHEKSYAVGHTNNGTEKA